MIVAGNLVKRGISLVQQLDQRRPTPLQLQQRTLLSLLKRAEKTAFGQHYGFEQILKAADPASVFQELVPMHDYNRMFDEWWRRTLAGEADVSWRGPVKYFALSSGTSEAASK